MNFPNTNAPMWGASQASPWITVNEALFFLDAFASRSIIEDRDLTAPPGSCANGARYLIAATATGAWAGKDGKMAIAVGTNASNGWLFATVAAEGTELYVRDENLTIVHDGATWSTSGPTEASASEIWAGSSTTKFISPSKALAAQVPATLTSSSSITPNGANGFNFTLTLAHSATLQNPSNFGVGQSGYIEITQSAGGGFTLAYGSDWRFPGGAPVLSTGAGAIDLLVYTKVASGRILATLTKGYSA